MMVGVQEIWDLWYPEAAAQGLPFARGRLDEAAVLLVHAAPPVLAVAVRRDDGTLIARGEGLQQTADRWRASSGMANASPGRIAGQDRRISAARCCYRVAKSAS